jgi:hypothetical protein
MTKEIQLQKLVTALERMIAILELDPSCQWINTFKRGIVKAKQLQSAWIPANT